ncbi:hypothetical protein [Streptomyces sp. NPDC054849]
MQPQPPAPPRPAGRAQDPGGRPVSDLRRQALYVFIAAAIAAAILFGNIY